MGKASSSKAARRAAARPSLSPSRALTWWVFVGVLVAFLLTASYETGRVLINDTFFTAYPAFTLGQFGTLNINTATAYTDRGWAFILDGNLRSDRFPGPILVAAPFYGIFGGKGFSLAPSAVVAALTTAAAVAFLHRSLLRVVPARTATGATLLFAFGTAAWTVAADGLWTHGPTLLGLSFAMWALGSQRYWLTGAGYILAIMSRPHVAVVAAVQGVWQSIVSRSWRPAVQVGAVSALGLVGLILYNRVNANSWDIFPGTYGGRFDAATTTAPGGQANADLWVGDVLATLGSPARGMLLLSPFLLMAIPGLRAGWVRAPAWARSSAIGALTYLIIQLAGNTWIGAVGIFGNRLVLEPLLLTMPLFAVAWASWAPKRRWAVVATSVLGFAALWWHAVASVVPAVDLGALDPAPPWSEWAVAQAVAAAGPVIAVVGALFAAGVVFAITRVPGSWAVDEPAPIPSAESRSNSGRKSAGGDDGKPKSAPAGSSHPRVKGGKKRR